RAARLSFSSRVTVIGVSSVRTSASGRPSPVAAVRRNPALPGRSGERKKKRPPYISSFLDPPRYSGKSGFFRLFLRPRRCNPEERHDPNNFGVSTGKSGVGLDGKCGSAGMVPLSELV